MRDFNQTSLKNPVKPAAKVKVVTRKAQVERKRVINTVLGVLVLAVLLQLIINMGSALGL